MWHLTRERLLGTITTVMTLTAGTMFFLYETKRTEPHRPGAQVRSQATASPGHSAGPAPTATGTAMKAGYAVRGKWKDGFNAEVTVTNLGAQPIEGWTVHLKMPTNVDITGSWGAAADLQPGALTLRSQPWNTYLEPGRSIRMGFEAKGAAADPTSCTINGSPC